VSWRAVCVDDFVTMREAQELLGVSSYTINQMVRDGRLTTYERPADRRRRYVKREQIVELQRPRLVERNSESKVS